MKVCKHCGAEIKENLEYCPNCGQKNIDSDNNFFDLEEELKSDYNIFDDADDFDALFSQEFMKKETWISVSLILVLWFLASLTLNNEFLLPGPFDVVISMANQIQRSDFLSSIFMTCKRLQKIG